MFGQVNTMSQRLNFYVSCETLLIYFSMGQGKRHLHLFEYSLLFIIINIISPSLTKTFIYVCNNLLFNINLLIDRVFWISAYLQPLLGLSYEKFIIFMNVLIMRFSVIAQAF